MTIGNAFPPYPILRPLTPRHPAPTSFYVRISHTKIGALFRSVILNGFFKIVIRTMFVKASKLHLKERLALLLKDVPILLKVLSLPPYFSGIIMIQIFFLKITFVLKYDKFRYKETPRYILSFSLSGYNKADICPSDRWLAGKVKHYTNIPDLCTVYLYLM